MKRLLLLMFIVSLPALGKISVVTSTTDLAWAAKQIGGDLVEVKSLLRGTENPHYLDASPSFIRAAASADVVCFVGMDLEVGWLPKVLSRSGNRHVQPGGKGYCEVGTKVKALEVPTGPVDRSMGDVHPKGNPHFWLGPEVFGKAAAVITQSLINVDAANTKAYNEGLKKFQASMQLLQRKNTAKLQQAFGKNLPLLIEYHKEFSYFVKAYGLRSYGSIEEKPGVPPSAGRIAQVAKAATASRVQVVLGATYSPQNTMRKFHELSGIPFIIVPTSVPLSGELADYEKLQEYIVDSIITATSKPKLGRNLLGGRTDSKS